MEATLNPRNRGCFRQWLIQAHRLKKRGISDFAPCLLLIQKLSELRIHTPSGRAYFGAAKRLASVIWLLGFSILLLTLPLKTSRAADYRTANFLVQAPNQSLAYQVAQAAEAYRHDLAVYWLGTPLPNWPNPCPILVTSGDNLPAQGVTTYNPIPARDFQMQVVGSPERILDSVLPHEITHTVLATHFRRPLPRWADEGICTTVEHHSEKSKHEKKLIEFLQSHRGIAMNHLFLMKEYPQDVLPMYAQGYSVCQFLIQQKGPREFIRFLGDYLKEPSWTLNVKRHYGYASLQEFQDYWIAWVASGSGPTDAFAKLTATATTVMQASLNVPAGEPSPNQKQSIGLLESRLLVETGETPTKREIAGLSQFNLSSAKFSHNVQFAQNLQPAPQTAIDSLAPPPRQLALTRQSDHSESDTTFNQTISEPVRLNSETSTKPQTPAEFTTTNRSGGSERRSEREEANFTSTNSYFSPLTQLVPVATTGTPPPKSQFTGALMGHSFPAKQPKNRDTRPQKADAQTDRTELENRKTPRFPKTVNDEQQDNGPPDNGHLTSPFDPISLPLNSGSRQMWR